MKRVAGILIVVAVFTNMAELPANAAFPGRNGKVVFLKGAATGASSIWTLAESISPPRLLYAHPTNEPTRLQRPQWSPDGREILFTADYDLWILSLDTGEASLLAQDASHGAWSPDGSKIVFVGGQINGPVNGPGTDLWTINRDGSELDNITADAACEGDPTWAPDGETIVFSRTTERWEGYLPGFSCGESWRENVATDIYYLDLLVRPRAPLPLLAGPDYAESRPDFSPDGSSLVFQCWKGRNRICLHHFGSAAAREIYNRRAQAMDPVWSPDGTRLIFVFKPGTEEDSDTELSAMDPDGSNVRRLTDNRKPDRSPDWQAR